MFHRINLEEWHNLLSAASLTLFFIVFLFVLLRVALLPKQERTRLENMPLEREDAHD